MDTSRFHVVFGASLQITEVIPFGDTPKDIRAGRAEMPAEGVRSDNRFEGTCSGQLSGRYEGIDYYTMLPNGDGRSHGHGVLTTDDGKPISCELTGVLLVQPGMKTALLRQTMHLHSTDPALAWVNREPFFVVGEFDMETYEATLTAYSAMEEMAARG